MKMQFSEFMQYLFYSLLSFCAVYVTGTLSKLRESIDSLNAHIATLLEKTSWHEKQIERHDEKISNIEKHIIQTNNKGA